MRRTIRGFTLIELMIVIAIIAIIAAIAIPSILEARKSSNEAAAVGFLKALHTAQELFNTCSANGLGKQDHSALCRAIEIMSNHQIANAK